MTIKANGRLALMLAAGLFVCLAGPSQAATGADNAAAGSKTERASRAAGALHKHVRHGSRHWKSYAHRKSGRVALKSDDGARSSVIPPSVANANAQWPPPIPRPAKPKRCPHAPTRSCRPRRPIRPKPSRPPTPRWSPPISSTMSIARCTEPAARRDHGDGFGRGACHRPHGACVGKQQRKLHLGPDLPDRKDLHRLRRAADDGLRRAHVHGVRTIVSPTLRSAPAVRY